MRKKFRLQQGEIATIIALSSMAFILVTALISKTFINKPQTTSSLAAQTFCDPKGIKTSGQSCTSNCDCASCWCDSNKCSSTNNCASSCTPDSQTCYTQQSCCSGSCVSGKCASSTPVGNCDANKNEIDCGGSCCVEEACKTKTDGTKYCLTTMDCTELKYDCGGSVGLKSYWKRDCDMNTSTPLISCAEAYFDNYLYCMDESKTGTMEGNAITAACKSPTQAKISCNQQPVSFDCDLTKNKVGQQTFNKNNDRYYCSKDNTCSGTSYPDTTTACVNCFEQTVSPTPVSTTTAVSLTTLQPQVTESGVTLKASYSKANNVIIKGGGFRYRYPGQGYIEFFNAAVPDNQFSYFVNNFLPATDYEYQAILFYSIDSQPSRAEYGNVVGFKTASTSKITPEDYQPPDEPGSNMWVQGRLRIANYTGRNIILYEIRLNHAGGSTNTLSSTVRLGIGSIYDYTFNYGCSVSAVVSYTFDGINFFKASGSDKCGAFTGPDIVINVR